MSQREHDVLQGDGWNAIKASTRRYSNEWVDTTLSVLTGGHYHECVVSLSMEHRAENGTRLCGHNLFYEV